MKAIWKFPVPTTDEGSVLEMPRGAEILTVQTQGDSVQLWALVDPDAQTELRTFKTYGTGQSLDHCPGVYVSTYQIRGGALVFHVFELARGETRKRLNS